MSGSPPKRVEEVVGESEHRWRMLTEALPQLVWSATPDGACDYFSTQWTEHTGVPERDLLGWRWLQVLHPDDREPTREFWTDSVAERCPYDVEYRVRRADGVYRWFKTRGVPIRDHAGNIFKWFGTCTDITDLKSAEEALREAKNAAESLNAELASEVRQRKQNESQLAAMFQASLIRERAELSATRLILLASGDRPGDPSRIRELQIDAHLLKPVQQDELLETIYQVMSRLKGDVSDGDAGRAGQGICLCTNPGRDTIAHPGGWFKNRAV